MNKNRPDYEYYHESNITIPCLVRLVSEPNKIGIVYGYSCGHFVIKILSTGKTTYLTKEMLEKINVQAIE